MIRRTAELIRQILTRQDKSWAANCHQVRKEVRSSCSEIGGSSGTSGGEGDRSPTRRGSVFSRATCEDGATPSRAICHGHVGGEGDLCPTNRWRTLHREPWPSRGSALPRHGTSFPRERRRRRVSPPYQNVADFPTGTMAEQTLGPPSASHTFYQGTTAAKGLAALPGNGALLYGYNGRADARPSLGIADLSTGTTAAKSLDFLQNLANFDAHR